MKNIAKEIERSGQAVKKIMQDHLSLIASDIIKKVMRNAKKSTKASILNSTKDIKPAGVVAYKADLLSALAVISSEAIDQARSEIPKAKKVKFIENQERLLLGEFEELPSPIRKRIKSSNDLLIGTQIADLEKAIYFQFASSANAGLPMEEIEADLIDKSSSYIDGVAISSGSSVVAANMVNEARNAFFFQDDVLEEISAFEFMNGDPVSPICNDLAGTIFDKKDPNFQRYTPPLHYNCKSWIRPILTLRKDQSIDRLDDQVTKTGKKSIQFSEINDIGNPEIQNNCCINL